MYKTTLLSFLLAGTAAFAQEEAPRLFVEAHYTGISYEPVSNDAAPWSSGFGVTLNNSLTRVVSLELAYDFAGIKETHGGTVHYSTLGQHVALRIGLGKATEKWSLRGLVGFGARFTDKVNWEWRHEGAPSDYQTSDGVGGISLDLGARYTYSIGTRFSINATTYVNLMIPRDEMSSSYHPANTLPLNAFALFCTNVGAAYRFDI